MSKSSNMYKLAAMVGEYAGMVRCGAKLKDKSEALRKVTRFLDEVEVSKQLVASEIVRVYGTDEIARIKSKDNATLQETEEVVEETSVKEVDDTPEAEFIDPNEVMAEEQAEAKKARDAMLKEKAKKTKKPKTKLAGTVTQRRNNRVPGVCVNCGSDFEGHPNKFTCSDFCKEVWKEDNERDKKSKAYQEKWRANKKAQEAAKKENEDDNDDGDEGTTQLRLVGN